MRPAYVQQGIVVTFAKEKKKKFQSKKEKGRYISLVLLDLFLRSTKRKLHTILCFSKALKEMIVTSIQFRRMKREPLTDCIISVVLVPFLLIVIGFFFFKILMYKFKLLINYNEHLPSCIFMKSNLMKFPNSEWFYLSIIGNIHNNLVAYITIGSHWSMCQNWS